MKYKIIIAAAAMGLSFAACDDIGKNIDTTKEETKPMNEVTEKGIDLNNLNTTVIPGNDFFQYANGGWLAANPIPGASYIVSSISSINAWISFVTDSTGLEICFRKESGAIIIFFIVITTGDRPTSYYRQVSIFLIPKKR